MRIVCEKFANCCEKFANCCEKFANCCEKFANGCEKFANCCEGLLIVAPFIGRFLSSTSTESTDSGLGKGDEVYR